MPAIRQGGANTSSPSPEASIGPVTEAAIVVQLRDRNLKIPVDGVDRDDLVDTFTDARGRARTRRSTSSRRGTRKSAPSKTAGSRSSSPARPAASPSISSTPPAHSPTTTRISTGTPTGLREGQIVEAGDVIGYVGSTGNASPDAPHLALRHLPSHAGTPMVEGRGHQPLPDSSATRSCTPFSTSRSPVAAPGGCAGPAPRPRSTAPGGAAPTPAPSSCTPRRGRLMPLARSSARRLSSSRSPTATSRSRCCPGGSRRQQLAAVERRQRERDGERLLVGHRVVVRRLGTG